MMFPTFEMALVFFGIPLSFGLAALGFIFTSNAKRLSKRWLEAIVWSIGALIVALACPYFIFGFVLSLEGFVTGENMLPLPAYILEVFLIYRIFFRKRATPIGLCSKCGYDLRASPERCPECGLVISIGST